MYDLKERKWINFVNDSRCGESKQTIVKRGSRREKGNSNREDLILVFPLDNVGDTKATSTRYFNNLTYLDNMSETKFMSTSWVWLQLRMLVVEFFA